jgi:ribosomal protein L37AE/L43A
MAIGSSKKADVDKMILRPNDPKEYSQICPQCQKRYGEAAKEIDIVRCATCPPFHASGAYWYGQKNKRYLRKLQRSIMEI